MSEDLPSGDVWESDGERVRLEGNLMRPDFQATITGGESAEYRVESIKAPETPADADLLLSFGKVTVSVGFTVGEARAFADHLVTAAEHGQELKREEPAAEEAANE